MSEMSEVHHEEPPKDREAVEREFYEWLKKVGLGGVDNHQRPNILVIPSTTSWEEWRKTRVGKARVEQNGAFVEPLVMWSPAGGFGDEILHRVDPPSLFDLVKQFWKDRFLPQIATVEDDSSVWLHIHPETTFSHIHSASWLSPQDLASLVAFPKFHAVVAMAHGGRYFMAIKSPRTPDENGYKLLNRVNKAAESVVGRSHKYGEDRLQTQYRTIHLCEKLFGKKSGYDMAFYLGRALADGRVLMRRFEIGMTENDDGAQVNLRFFWRLISEADEEKLSREAAEYQELKLTDLMWKV